MGNLHLREGKVEFRWKRWRNKKRQEISACLMVLFGGLALFGGGSVAQAGPTGGQITSGTGSIATSGPTTTIGQSSQVLDINWQTFSTTVGESVNFNQPNASALAINRVVGGVPSQLAGALNANGRVFILNSAGITFTGTSHVNVGALLATTAMTIDGDPTKNASYSGTGYGAVINQGSIQVSNGGFAILAAPNVQNTGFIKADLGTIALAGTNQFTLDLSGNGLINFVVPAGTLQQITADGKALGVDNSGKLQARSGQVIISANVATQVINSVVNMTGVVDADAFTSNGSGGSVLVSSSGAVNVTGTITAAGSSQGAGGQIAVNGSQVANQGSINASGQSGGAIAIAGASVINQGFIRADGTGGPGGAISVKFKNLFGSSSASLISATGKTQGGSVAIDGGIAGSLTASGKVDVTSTGGEGGDIGVYARDITLEAAKLDASGQTGGGTIQVGGSAAGGGSEPNAETVDIDSDSILSADATGVGNGGSILLWSEASTTFAGAISARGGPAGGDGGSVEISSRQQLNLTGTVDLRAPLGKTGTLLLDPENLTIQAAGPDTATLSGQTATANADGSILTTDTLTSLLGTSNVLVQTNAAPGAQAGDITVADSFGWSGDSNLTISAYDNILVNDGVTITHNSGSGGLTLQADNTGTGAGTVSFLGSGPQVDFSGSSGAISIFYNPASYIAPTDYTGDVSLGGGTLIAYMLINDVTNLQDIQTNLTGTYALGRNIDASDTATWDGGAGFVPLGQNVTAFTGILNGQGHTIDGLVINRPSDGGVGLFSTIGGGGVVSNLGLTNVSVTGADNVGGLAGDSNGANVIQSYSTGTVTGVGANGAIGGLVGGYVGGIIFDSYSAAAVSGTSPGTFGVGGLVGVCACVMVQSYSEGSVAGSDAVGGLVGWLTFGGSIEQSHSTGAISGSNTVGGLVGSVGKFDNVDRSYSTSAVTVLDRSTQVGGLVGSSIGTITQSQAEGTVMATGSNSVGGLAGFNGGTVSGSSSTETVNASGFEFIVGGLVGVNSGLVDGSSANGSVSADGTSFQLGGLVGGNSGGTVSNSTTSGTVSATGDGGVVGGLVGYNDPSGVIQSSSSSVDVSATDTNADTGGSLQGMAIGGLVGENANVIDASSATGTVTATGNGVFIGGLAGANDSFASISGSSASGAVSLTTLDPGTPDFFGAVGGLVGVNKIDATITNSQAGGDVSGTGSEFEAGGLVGTNNSTLDSVSIANNTVTASGLDIDVGGLVGGNYGTISNATSTNTTVTGSGDDVETGGLVGWNGKMASDGTPAIIDSSSATNATVTLTEVEPANPANTQGSDVGGLVGGSRGTITNSLSSGTVTAIENDGDQVTDAGGLAGFSRGAIANSSSSANVTGDWGVGGLVGALTSKLGSGDGVPTYGSIDNSFSTGTVTGEFNVGGLVGFVNTRVGTGTTITNSWSSATVDGTWFVGGLVGAVQSDAATSTITNSYSMGAVTGERGSIGGLVGNNGGAIESSYSLSPVTVDNPAGGNNVGGLVGENLPGWSISDSYAMGAVTFTTGFEDSPTVAYSAIGGLVGYNDGGATITNSTTGHGGVPGGLVSATGSNLDVGGLIGGNSGSLDSLSIVNASVSGNGIDLDVGGLIGGNYGGTVINSMTGGTVSASGDGDPVGGLIGYNDPSGVIESSSSSAIVSATDTNADTGGSLQGMRVGGLVGGNWNVVDNSSATGAVSGNGNGMYVGGLVGANRPSGIITNSHATGAVSLTTLDPGTPDFFGAVGGLVGYNDVGATLQSSMATGEVSGTGSEFEAGGLVGTNNSTLDSVSITNNTVNASGLDIDVGGLVGGNYGTISNATSTNTTVMGSGDDVETGGLVGWNSSTGTIEAASANATVSGTDPVSADIAQGSDIGGLAGGSKGTITGSSASGTVTMSADPLIFFDAGMLTGFNAGTITLSHSSGTVSGINNVGGLVGNNRGAIAESYSSATVSGVQRIGGLVGSDVSNKGTSGTIDQSYSMGTVSGSAYVGGLVGTVGNINNAGSAITNSYSTSSVIGDSGSQFVGGLVGSLGSNTTISQSYSTGDVTTASTSLFVGGLVGIGLPDSLIDTSYSTGTVTALDGSSQVGGLVGSNNGTISRSYTSGAVSASSVVGGLAGSSAGAITQSYSTSAVLGDTEVGGLVGYQDSSGTITQVYSSGFVSGSNNVGGLVGFNNNGTISSDSYWDKTTSGQTASAGSPNENGLASVDMANQASYIGWDFGTDWYLEPGMAHPILRSEYDTNVVNGHQLELMQLGLGASYTLGANIALGSSITDPAGPWGSAGFIPLGDPGTPFTGTLDGQGHTIDGLMINGSGAASYGLFGFIGTGGLVTHVGLTNATVSGSGNVGTIAGFSDGTVAQSYSTGTVTGNSGTYVAGGLIGGTGLDSTITDSYSTASVAVSGSASTAQTGGLVGSNSGAIANSTAQGPVATEGSNTTGGLAGFNQGVISGSSYSGDITQNDDLPGDIVGGLVGFNTGVVDGSHVTADIAANGGSVLGSLVGINGGTVSNSTAAGSLTASGDGITAGGLVGYNTGAIQNSSSSVDVSATDTNADTGGSLQGMAIGGLVGENANVVNASSATGTVAGTGNGTHVGGLVGHNDSGASISASSASGAASLTTLDPGTPDFFGAVGGLVGVNDAGATLTNSTATGDVSGTGSEFEAGGLVGTNNSTLDSVSIANNTVTASGLDIDVGGLVGGNYGTISNATSTNTTVTGSGDDVETGGLVGWNGKIANFIPAVITSSSANMVNVTLTEIEPAANAQGSDVGGLVGGSRGTISNSTSSGTVTAIENDGDQLTDAGGLAGFTRGAISGSSSSANVTGDWGVGGLVGAELSKIGGDNELTIGSIDSSFSTGTVTGEFNVGGLVGYVNTRAGQTGTSITNSWSSATVDGTWFVGGLVGAVQSDAATSTITNSYSMGAVTGERGSIGGLVGNNGGAIESSYSLSPVTVDNPAGGNNVGGLVGENLPGWSISDSYAMGAVTYTTGFEDAPTVAYSAIGGLVGWNDNGATITNSTTGNNGLPGGPVTATGSNFDVGGLVGGNGGTLDGLSVSGNTVSVTGNSVDFDAGGLLGGNYGTLSNASATSTVTTLGDSASIGGLVGWNSPTGVITNSSATADVTGTDPASLNSEAGIDVGGLVGASRGTITGSWSSGTVAEVEAADGTNSDAGGLVGWDAGSIAQSHSSADVTGVWEVGGLVGNEVSKITSNGPLITVGSIDQSYSTGTVTGEFNVGGLVGLAHIRNGTTATSITDSYSTSTVSGSSQVGGLVGLLTSDPGLPGSTITGSWSSGTVSGDQQVGGLVGEVDAGNSIANSYSTGTVSGTDNVGGLAGYNAGTIMLSYSWGGVAGSGESLGGLVGYNDYSGDIEQSYATGAVAGGDNVGGLVGSNGGTINASFSSGFVSGTGSNLGGLIGNDFGSVVTNSYWDITTSGQQNSAGGPGASGLTAADLQAGLPQPLIDAGFAIVPGTGTPYLQSQFNGTPEVVSGTAYGDHGVTPLAGGTVSVLLDGTSVGGVSIGANGAYDLLLAPGTIGAGADDLLAYISSGNTTGNTFDDGVTGSVSGLDIYGGYLRLISGGTSLSGIATDAQAALGANSGPALLYANAGGTLSVLNGANLEIDSTAPSLTVDQSVIAGGTITATVPGDLVIAASGQMTSGASGNAITLVDGGSFSNNAGSNALSLTGGGRFLVYSQNPTNDNRGGLAYDFKQYGATYGVTAPAQATGNGFLYEQAPAPLTASLTGTVSKIYDGTTAATLSAANYQVSGAVDGDVIALSATTGSYNNKNVGAGKAVTFNGLTVAATDGGAVVYGYQLASTSLSGNVGAITPATLTYAANTVSRSYGTANGTLNGTVNGLVNGETLAGATNGTLKFTTTATSSSNVGQYAINGSGLTAVNGNYVFVQSLGNASALTINPAVLTYTAHTATRIYGAADPTFTGTVTGFKLGQTQATATTGTMNFTSVATSTSSVGQYEIDGSGLTANNGNYVFVQAPVNATALTINPATLTYNANAASRTYGAVNPTLSGTVTGFANGETVASATSGSLAFATTATQSSNVGKYAISGSGLTANNGNYVFVQAAGNTTAMNVTPATLTYVANSGSRTYGAANPTYTGTVTGFVLGQTQATATGGTLKFTTTAAASSNVGQYAINGSGLTAVNGNYVFAQSLGNASALTINPATLTYTANAASRLYGSANPALSGTVTGFVLGQTQATATTGLLTFTTPAVTTTNVGTYAINGGGLTANNGNYVFVQAAVNANRLTISPVTLTYNANAASRTYGAANPALSGTVTGFVLGQNLGTVTGGTLAWTTTATNAAGTNVGQYAINGSGLTANFGNYVFAQNALNATAMNVTPATLTYLASSASKLQGAANPVLTGTVTGFVYGQTVATATSGTLKWTTNATKTSPVGSYFINGSGLSAVHGNYVFVQAPSNATALTIH